MKFDLNHFKRFFKSVAQILQSSLGCFQYIYESNYNIINESLSVILDYFIFLTVFQMNFSNQRVYHEETCILHQVFCYSIVSHNRLLGVVGEKNGFCWR